jgi:hypothetical protein
VDRQSQGVAAPHTTRKAGSISGPARRCKVSKSSIFKAVVIAVLAIGIVLAFSACGGDDASLVGQWTNEGEGETLELTSDGKAVMDDMEGTYTAEGGKLTLTILEQAVVFDYVLDSDSLKLTYEGESMTYDRVK